MNCGYDTSCWAFERQGPVFSNLPSQERSWQDKTWTFLKKCFCFQLLTISALFMDATPAESLDHKKEAEQRKLQIKKKILKFSVD